MYSEKNLVYMGIWGESNCILFKQSKKLQEKGFRNGARIILLLHWKQQYIVFYSNIFICEILIGMSKEIKKNAHIWRHIGAFFL